MLLFSVLLLWENVKCDVFPEKFLWVYGRWFKMCTFLTCFIKVKVSILQKNIPNDLYILRGLNSVGTFVLNLIYFCDKRIFAIL